MQHKAKKKYSFVFGASGDENKSHAGGRRIFFFGKYVEMNIVENSEFNFLFTIGRINTFPITNVITFQHEICEIKHEI